MADGLPISSGAALNQAHQANKPQQSAQSSHSRQGATSSMAAETQAHTGNQTAAQNSVENAKNTGKEAHQKDFNSMFHDVMDGDTAQADKQASTVDPTQLLKADKDSKANDNAEQADSNAAAAIPGMPMLAADTGKGLPQLNWSGMVAVADNNGASAMAMKGDQAGAIATPVVSGNNLPNAVLKAQEQMANAQLQQNADTANQTTDFSNTLSKEALPSLHMSRQFVADNSTLIQGHDINTTAATNSQHGMFNQLNAAMGAGAARTADTNLQQINVPLQHPQWQQQLGDRVQWLIGHNLNQADIHLNPPELGALDVRIQVHGDQASVNFASPHAVVRHALDAAIPRLREMMQETGLMLGDVNVSGQALTQQQSRDPQSQQGQSGRASSVAAVDEPAAISSTSPLRRLSANSMLDVYA